MKFAPARFAKATNAAITAGLTGLALVIAGDGSIAITDLTAAQWTTLGLGVACAFWTTYNTSNAAPVDPPGEHAAPEQA